MKNARKKKMDTTVQVRENRFRMKRALRTAFGRICTVYGEFVPA
jgi:hypothetical protein